MVCMPATLPNSGIFADTLAVFVRTGAGEPLTTTEVADALDVGRRTAYNRLARLAEDGAIRTKKVGASARVWWRPLDPTDVTGSEAVPIEVGIERAAFRSLVDVEDEYAIFALDPDGNVVTWSEGAERIGGYTAAEAIGLHVSALYPESEREAGVPTSTLASATRLGSVTAEGWRLRHDGSTFWAVHTITAILDGAGDLLGFSTVVIDTTERREREGELERLDRLNSVIRKVLRVVSRSRTRAAMAEGICETLLEFDRFRLSLIGEFAPKFDSFETWAYAGTVDGQFESIVGSGRPSLVGNVGAIAAKTGDVQIRRDVEDLEDSPWKRAALEAGIRSYIAVPLVNDGARFGVLGLYASRPALVDESSRALLTELGESIGFALDAIERRDLLEPSVDVEFNSPAFARGIRGVETDDVEFVLESVVKLREGRELQYWLADSDNTELADAVFDHFERIRDVQLLSVGDGVARYELDADAGSLDRIFDAFGGELRSMAVVGETGSLVGRVPAAVDLEALETVVREWGDDVELVSIRRIVAPTSLKRLVEGDLTDRQLAALKAAYFRGYYDVPRTATGEAIADRLGITKQTFHTHLRKGESTVFSQLFDPQAIDGR